MLERRNESDFCRIHPFGQRELHSRSDDRQSGRCACAAHSDCRKCHPILRPVQSNIHRNHHRHHERRRNHQIYASWPCIAAGSQQPDRNLCNRPVTGGPKQSSQTNYAIVNIIADGIPTIGQAFASILWTNPTPIVYGTSLSSIQLNATATAQGTFAYSPSNGATLATGTNTLSVQFTPSDTFDYLGATTTVSMVIAPAPLTVTATNASRPLAAVQSKFYWNYHGYNEWG